MSLEMAHKVILPPKKNYIPQFLKQRDINSYYRHQSKKKFPVKRLCGRCLSEFLDWRYFSQFCW
jgi:hypothetical protein